MSTEFHKIKRGYVRGGAKENSQDKVDAKMRGRELYGFGVCWHIFMVYNIKEKSFLFRKSEHFT